MSYQQKTRSSNMQACHSTNHDVHDQAPSPPQQCYVHHTESTRQPVADITALPGPLLEKILLVSTSLEDKKMLRQTCRYFQQVLDNNLVCIQLKVHDSMGSEEFTKCMKHFGSITKLGMATEIFDASKNMSSLLICLPNRLTTLILNCENIDVKELARLPCLTALYLDSFVPGYQGGVKGIEYLSGLTSLHCDWKLGSLAHLAPTLKHLSIWGYNYVQGMNELTNLETLSMFSAPPNFFQENRHLPLKQLSLNCYQCRELFSDSKAWQSAPTTLTCLTLSASGKRLPDVLPVSITHLQLLNASDDEIKQAATALPSLCSLDVYTNAKGSIAGNLSKLTNLQSLRICLEETCRGYMSRQQLLQAQSDVALAIARGVKLDVITTVDEWYAVFGDPIRVVKPAWAYPT